MRITLPDGSIKEFDASQVTALNVAESIGAGLAKAAIGAKVDGQLVDLNRPITHDATVAIVTKPRKGPGDAEALYLLRHSTAHVMAEAIQRLWPEAQLAYGPPLDTGFYYDIKLDTPISSDDFPKIEAEMKKIVEENRPFTRYELPPEAGIDRLNKEGNKYKIDNAERAIAGGAGVLSWYVTGEVDKNWEDLCMGPHVPATGLIGAFKITSVASSHWHGDVDSDRFQRVYGTAFFTQADLDQHLNQLEEAKARDHRVIGAKLGLFAIDEQVGQGLILWKPKGGMIRSLLQEFLQAELMKRGYDVVYTPHIGKIDLYKTSGHYPYYSDSQFPPIKMRDSDEEYLLKPMNCPHHIKIFGSEPHSYRDLPIRLAEFGTVYRFEQSGELTGMTRVRGFTQDDAHIFCTHDQVAGEFRATVELVQFVFNTFGFEDVSIRLSLHDPDSDKFAGDAAVWDRAENELRQVLSDMGIPFTEAKGEAAFYGPKVDFIVRDVIGRPWQLGTVQLDYTLPERFKIEYVDADNSRKRPVMIHRAPFGSMERFMAILIEHYAGAFPLWLSPEQVRVLPISDKFSAYADKVLAALKSGGLRATMDSSNDRVNAKIKVAQEQKIPYMLVVGGKDQDAGTVSVRERAAGDLGALPLDKFVEMAKAEVASRGASKVKV
ncbi:MAG: threonine--tRNA ligase [Planctomycetes bacterium]|nr:threonine--tRNA ligase [Planctomycetota bacterium]